MPDEPLHKRFLPKGLLGRSLLILVTPLVLLQLVSAYVFFGTHWDVVTRRLAIGLAGDIRAVMDLMHDFPEPEDQDRIRAIARNAMSLTIAFEPNAILDRIGMIRADAWSERQVSGLGLETNLIQALNDRVGRPMFIDARDREDEIVIRIQLSDGVLEVAAPRKRLYSSTMIVFILWMVGTSLLLTGIATLFMRNQVRAVRRLAAAADRFGKGRDVPDFHPEGAAEVRQAAAAFTKMRERIKRQISQRTEMLAGVSHDLRTPLTRMKLQLAMMDSEGSAELSEDVADMEHMIDGYLAFARGDGAEKLEQTDLPALIESCAAKMRRGGVDIDVHCEEKLTLPLRPHAVERALTNLLSNAGRYAHHVAIRARKRDDAAEILIDDDGPGIPRDQRGAVFKPFFRLEGSRNQSTGGIGLGLTIVRDLVRGHGGDVLLEDSPLGGLRVRLRLPL